MKNFINKTGTYFELAKVVRSVRIPSNCVNKRFPQWMNRDTFMMLSEIENAEKAVLVKEINQPEIKEEIKVEEKTAETEISTQEVKETKTVEITEKPKRGRKPSAKTVKKAATAVKKTTTRGRKSKTTEE